MYKVRTILDVEQDVLRTLLIDEHKSLEDLHFALAKSFGFDGQEMASFYYANERWEQGQEIPLFEMDETEKGTSMASYIIKDILPNKNDKLIYVYDFLNMWIFYVEIVDISEEKVKEPKIILTIGEMPKSKKDDEFNFSSLDNFDDEFNKFDRLDDLDMESY